MVSYTEIKSSNESLEKALPSDLIAVFLGATSGIGLSTLKQFAERAIRPRIYIAGRNAAALDAIVADLRQRNQDGIYESIQKDVSLIRDVNDIASWFSAKETKLDYLFLSAGFISFNGRQETDEALDATMTTRYYTRIRAIQLLLPRLNSARSPRVISILAGGQEAAMVESDLDLRDPKNYSIPNAAVHSATMGTLMLQRFARENPHISFIHSFPGAVQTPLLTRGSTGIVQILFRYLIVPFLHTFIAMTAEEAGARVMYYATSERFSVDRTEQQIKAARLGGVFLVDAKSESAGNEKLFQDFKDRDVEEKVWKHTQQIYGACSN